MRKGLALTPVKFGISFTATQYNQAGALVHVYTDGSVHLNHGGTEMGQGLYIKVAQVVAEEFQIDIDKVRITATTTGKVPNTSATAASSGTDLNGKAAQSRPHADQGAPDRLRRRALGRAPRAGRVPAQPGARSAIRRSPSATWSGRPTWRASRSPRPASTRRPRSTGTGRAGTRPAVLLLRLWCRAAARSPSIR